MPSSPNSSRSKYLAGSQFLGRIVRNRQALHPVKLGDCRVSGRGSWNVSGLDECSILIDVWSIPSPGMWLRHLK